MREPSAENSPKDTSRVRVVGLSWERDPQATVYFVQAWVGDQLRFEEERADTTLSLDRSMLRSLRGAAEVEFVVLAGDGQGRRRRLEAPPATVLGVPSVLE